MYAPVTNKVIRFRFAAEKAKAAILFMLEQSGKHDLHAILKACYFADKDHLNKFTRPIFGAVYRAMKFGPVPLEIYEMLKGEPIWLAELSMDEFPWKLEGYQIKRTNNEYANLKVLSASDLEAIRLAYHLSGHMTFDFRTAMTHGRDWKAANMGVMKYEDMIEDGPDKARMIEYLQENARFMRL